MIELLLAALCLALLTPALIGTLVLWYVLVLPKKPPADTSNRIGHLRLVWWALRKPEAFVELFPWLTKDEGDVVK